MFNTHQPLQLILTTNELADLYDIKKHRLSSSSSYDSSCSNSPNQLTNSREFYEFNPRYNKVNPRFNEFFTYPSKHHTLNELNNRSSNNLMNYETAIEQSNECAFEKLMKLAETIFEYRVKKRDHQNVKNYGNSSMISRNFCKFCKNNMEPSALYMNHRTRDQNGQVTCPVLFKHRCEICNATGKFSHTRSYCPYSQIIRNNVRDVKSTYLFHNMKKLNSTLNCD